MTEQSINYQDYLITSLKDPKEATGYLSAALAGGDINVFLLALTDSHDPKQYLQRMKQRDPELAKGYVQIVHTLDVLTAGGKQQLPLKLPKPNIRRALPKIKKSLNVAVVWHVKRAQNWKKRPAKKLLAKKIILR